MIKPPTLYLFLDLFFIAFYLLLINQNSKNRVILIDKKKL